MNAPVKPDCEYFYDVPYKFFCGECGRLIAICGKNLAINVIKKHVTACPFCGTAVDWSNDGR